MKIKSGSAHSLQCMTRSAVVPPPGMLAIPQSQLPSLASAALQMPAASQPHSKGFQQQPAQAPPIITPSLGPSTQLLFAPGTLPGLISAAPQRQPQSAAAAEPIEIIGLDDDEEEVAGSEEEESEGQPILLPDTLVLRTHSGNTDLFVMDCDSLFLCLLCSSMVCRKTL